MEFWSGGVVEVTRNLPVLRSFSGGGKPETYSSVSQKKHFI